MFSIFATLRGLSFKLKNIQHTQCSQYIGVWWDLLSIKEQTGTNHNKDIQIGLKININRVENKLISSQSLKKTVRLVNDDLHVLEVHVLLHFLALITGFYWCSSRLVQFLLAQSRNYADSLVQDYVRFIKLPVFLQLPADQLYWAELVE